MDEGRNYSHTKLYSPPPILAKRTVWKSARKGTFLIGLGAFHPESFETDPTLGWHTSQDREIEICCKECVLIHTGIHCALNSCQRKTKSVVGSGARETESRSRVAEPSSTWKCATSSHVYQPIRTKVPCPLWQVVCAMEELNKACPIKPVQEARK